MVGFGIAKAGAFSLVCEYTKEEKRRGCEERGGEKRSGGKRREGKKRREKGREGKEMKNRKRSRRKHGCHSKIKTDGELG